MNESLQEKRERSGKRYDNPEIRGSCAFKAGTPAADPPPHVEHAGALRDDFCGRCLLCRVPIRDDVRRTDCLQELQGATGHLGKPVGRTEEFCRGVRRAGCGPGVQKHHRDQPDEAADRISGSDHPGHSAQRNLPHAIQENRFLRAVHAALSVLDGVWRHPVQHFLLYHGVDSPLCAEHLRHSDAVAHHGSGLCPHLPVCQQHLEGSGLEHDHLYRGHCRD